jgi:bifunctional isochorismate lyase / aryl carrier protein
MRTHEYAEPGNLEARTAAWLSAVRAATPPRPHLRIDPSRCALLVIDMLRYFADARGRCYLPATAAAIGRIALLRDAWHRMDALVVFTQHAHEGEHDLGMLGRFFSDHIRAGEPEAQIIDALTPRDGEPVVRKTTYDAFLDTPLASILEARHAEQVLVTGVLTHMCCETTARSAFCRGYEVFVAADATATSSEERHVNSLVSMADCVAVVMSAQEILDQCNTHA